MNTKALIDQVATLARTVLPLVVPGAAPALAIAEQVVKLIDNTRQTFGEKDTAVLTRLRDDLSTKVHAHARRTADRLDG